MPSVMMGVVFFSRSSRGILLRMRSSLPRFSSKLKYSFWTVWLVMPTMPRASAMISGKGIRFRYGMAFLGFWSLGQGLRSANLATRLFTPTVTGRLQFGQMPLSSLVSSGERRTSQLRWPS